MTMKSRAARPQRFALKCSRSHLRIGAGFGDHGLLVASDPMFNGERTRIVALATRSRLPCAHPWREFVEAGGLLSYAVNLPQMHRRMAAFVAKILKGARPADLPVEQPTTFEFVINLKTAKALGLTISQSLLLRADHVIE